MGKQDSWKYRLSCGSCDLDYVSKSIDSMILSMNETKARAMFSEWGEDYDAYISTIKKENE